MPLMVSRFNVPLASVCVGYALRICLAVRFTRRFPCDRRAWHAQWDSHIRSRGKAAHALAERIEQVLEEGIKGDGRSAKQIVTELTDLYGQLEETQRELDELKQPGVAEERLSNLQRGIQRFAALARFG